MSIGSLLERAMLYSFDEHGRKIRAPGPGDRRIKHGSSPAFQGSGPAPDEPTLDELIARSHLSPDEAAVMELKRKGYQRTNEVEVPVAELQQLLDEGWMLVRQEAGRATVSIHVVAHYTQEQIAGMLSMSRWQVRTLIQSANVKIKAAR
jgi:hypothetical protein